MSGTSGAQNAVGTILTGLGTDLSARLPERCVGVVPTVARQWLWVLSDAGFEKLGQQLSTCADALIQIAEGDPNTLGRQLPRELRKLGQIRATYEDAIQEASWFEPPPVDVAGDVVDRLVIASNQVLNAVEACLTCTPSRELVENAVLITRNVVAELVHTIGDPKSDDTPPIDMVRRLFGVRSDQSIGAGNLDPNLLRSSSTLDTTELEALSAKLLAHALPPAAQWVPNPTIFLAGLLLAERPLVAHRMLIFTRDLVMARFGSAPKAVTGALVAQRKRGQSQFASHKEIAAELGTLTGAQSSDDPEGVALATARLYAAAAEGPVRGAATTVLELAGLVVPPNSTLTFLRDNLRARTGAGLDHAIEPEWRNAVDHREYHWDPAEGKLLLRGDPIDPEEVFRRYAFGMSASAGIECGITIGVAASPGLIDLVDRAAPLQDDRVLVEHRLGQQLAVQGVASTSIRTTADGVEVGPLADAEADQALAALVGSEHLDRVVKLTILFESLPPLVTGTESRRRSQLLIQRDMQNRPVLDAAAAIPLIVDALIANGQPADDALSATLQLAGQSFGLDLSGITADRRRTAERVQRTAKRSRQAIREGELVAKGETASSRNTKDALRRLERSAEAYQMRDVKPDVLLSDLKRVCDLFATLPTGSIPWLEEGAPNSPTSRLPPT